MTKAFSPSVIKSGAAIRWNLGDGVVMVNNDITYLYGLEGLKVVRALSSDGPLGVTRIQIQSDDLVGGLPPELGRLTNLQYLSLDNNHFSGSIPPELGQITNLEVLWLHANALTGSIPPELSQLRNLQELQLASNQLTGSIPPELGKLTRLERLSFRSNDLTGSIPHEFGGLSSMAYLNLGWNKLVGSIPAELGTLRELVLISFAGNQLTGYEAGAFSGLFQLQNVYLNDNLFDEAAVDAIINDIYKDRGKHTRDYPNLQLGDATPSSAACSKIIELRASYDWTIACNGC